MNPKTKQTIVAGVAVIVIAGLALLASNADMLKAVPTKVPPAGTATSTRTARPTATRTLAVTSPTLAQTSAPSTPAQGNSVPVPGAPLCADSGASHDNSLFHTLWDSGRGCHYDHEHGVSPFTAQVALAFPGFNLSALLCGNEISHCNPSSPMENTHKHGGFKWQVGFNVPNPTTGGVCKQGFEDGAIAVKDYAIQFHAFGRQDIEHEARNHSSAALLSFCKDGNTNDLGYMYVVQLQEYGERVMPYQGMVMAYPDNFQPQWDGRRGQYFTTECFGPDFNFNDPIRGSIFIDCRPTFSDAGNNLTIWTSKITGTRDPANQRPPGSSLFTLLFRGRDNYQRTAGNDLVHPFTWMFVCGGTTYNPANCRYNSSTMTVHEVMGTIPAAWDGAAFDTDPRAGRISATIFVDRFGALLPATECTQAGGNCHPLVLVNAFVGRYSSEVSVNKVSNPTPADTPERDIYFCSGVVCSETSPGAVPSSWIGSEN